MSDIKAHKTCQNYNLLFPNNIKKMILNINDKKETITK